MELSQTNKALKVLRVADKRSLLERALLGLRAANAYLDQKGWCCNCIEQDERSFSVKLGTYEIDVSVREPTRVAYVTSKPGWVYKREVIGKTPTGAEIVRPTAVVQFASEFIRDAWVVQVVVTRDGKSQNPIYIPVNDNAGDPAIAVAINILLMLKNFNEKIDNVDEKIQHLNNQSVLELSDVTPANPTPVLLS